MIDTCNGIVIPQRMRRLPRYKDMPIPYTTWIDPGTQVPDFKIQDEVRRQRVIAKRKCSMCGEKLNQKMAFIGGPGSIEQGQLFMDAGMHPACAQFAWDVCPYIVLGRGHAEHRDKERPGTLMLVFRDIPTGPPERMGMMITSSYQTVEYNGNTLVKAGPVESVIWRTYPAPV